MTTQDDHDSAEHLDPTVVAVLALLWRAAQEAPPRRPSLAGMRKHAGLAMSTLQRTLAALEDAGLVQVVIDDRLRALALLTPHGVDFCAAMFAGATDQRAADATSRPTSFNADSVADDQAWL